VAPLVAAEWGWCIKAQDIKLECRVALSFSLKNWLRTIRALLLRSWWRLRCPDANSRVAATRHRNDLAVVRTN
jgi:hypothetical protein